MFEEIPSHQPQVLPIGTNILKGGDFMERDQNNPARQAAIKRAVERMEWEGAPILGGNPTINPDQENVPDDRNSPTHPLRKGRI